MALIKNRSNKLKPAYDSSCAFTIVELLIVIVVIGILTAITIVSYTGITQKANAASLQSDLANAAKKLDLYNAQYSSYPTAIDAGTGCPTAPNSDSVNCVKFSSGISYIYSSIGSTNYNLTATKGTISYRSRPSSSPTLATSSTSVAQPSNCPTGYIIVPGSTTYGTNDFCVMKYEAKIQGNNDGNQTYSAGFVPESRATGTPWVNISQTDSIAEAQTACTGCHLITEAEWMTLAQNVLSVASNWSGGVVGSGYIFSGHNDAIPANALVASTDNDGYFGTGQTSPSSQKRTLTLSNGEVIWDLAGNIWEWTNAQTFGHQPGIDGLAYNWRQWTSITNPGSLTVNPAPSTTGIAGSSSWDSDNGIGQIFSSSDEVGPRAFFRGGDLIHGSAAGVLTLHFTFGPEHTDSSISFRVSK